MYRISIFFSILLVFISSCKASRQTVVYTEVERTANFVSVKEFGAQGDGKTDDTEAIREAIKYIESQQISKTSFGGFNNKVYIGGVPTLYFPFGEYKISQELKLGYYISIIGDNSILFSSKPNNFCAFKGTGWQCHIEGIQFVGFETAIDLNNKNLDIGKIKITNCTFTEVDRGIIIDAQSTLTSITENRFINCSKALIVKSGDKIIFSDNWVTSSKLKGLHDAQIINHGTLHFNYNVLVPQPPIQGAVEPAWINNYKNISVDGVRQGGEPGSFTLINNFAKEDVTYPILPHYVSVDNSDCYAVYGNRRDFRQPAVVRIIEVPNSISVANIGGVVDAVVIGVSETVKNRKAIGDKLNKMDMLKQDERMKNKMRFLGQ